MNHSRNGEIAAFLFSIHSVSMYNQRTVNYLKMDI